MRIIRTALKLGRETSATYVLERLDGKFPVRTLYLEKKSVPSGLPDYVAVRLVVDESGAMGRFAQFLKERVEEVDDDEVDDDEVDDDEARITIGQIWAAWAENHGADADETEIEGIRLSNVGDLFRDRFNAGNLTRGRVDGRMHLCWRGYHTADAGSRERAKGGRTGA